MRLRLQSMRRRPRPSRHPTCRHAIGPLKELRTTMSSTWGNWHGSWERPDAGGHEAWTKGPTSGRPGRACPVALGSRLRLVDEDHDSLDGAHGGPGARRRGDPVVAAFTSQKHVNAMRRISLSYSTTRRTSRRSWSREKSSCNHAAGWRHLIDPASDDELYLPPELVDRIRAELKRL